MSKRPEFLVLKPTTGWLPESWWTKVLGAVVLNPHSPSSSRTPLNPPLEENDLVEMSFPDFIMRNDEVESSSCELEVKHLGHLRWQKSAGHNLELKGKLVYVKRLSEQPDFWKEMLEKDNNFAAKVIEWVKEKRWGRAKYEVCWVVGLLMCQEVAVSTSEDQAKEWEARGEVNLGSIVEGAAAAQGLPIKTGGLGDANAQAGSKTGNRSYFSVKGKEKYVFALELRVISAKDGKPQITDKMPKADKKLKLGDRDDNLEPEDLNLGSDLGEDDWENLLL